MPRSHHPETPKSGASQLPDFTGDFAAIAADAILARVTAADHDLAAAMLAEDLELAGRFLVVRTSLVRTYTPLRCASSGVTRLRPGLAC